MPVVIFPNTGSRRFCTLNTGSTSRRLGQAVQIHTTPPLSPPGGQWVVKAPTAAGKGDGILCVTPSGFSELTDANGQGAFYPIHSGGEQRLNAGAAVAAGKVVIDDADGNWIEAGAGVLGKYVALEAAAGLNSQFGARPALATEKN
jgi:hypothetical protein